MELHPQEQALLGAVEASPADDVPRLVYADWLEEHGQPIRAEFIRLQCEVARLEADRAAIRSHHAGLWRRQQELLDHHVAELLGPWQELAFASVQFARGFPERFTLRVGDFLTHGALLEACRPRPQVAVHAVSEDLAGFVRSPHLECVTHIAAYAAGLFERETSGWPGDEALLQAASRLIRLEVLDLEGCGIGDWFGELFMHFTLPALVELDLSNNHLSDVGVTELLRCTLPKRLILGGNPITDQGAMELADRLGRSSVEYLNLRGTWIGPAGHAALLATFDRAGKKVDLF